MSIGWIKLHRKMTEWEWYDDANTMRLFIHCLLKANHRDKMWRGKLIRRGTFLTSLSKLSSELSLSIQEVRTSLKKLKKTKEINTQSTSANTCISVTNYDDYQKDNKPSNKQVTNEQQTSNKRATTTKNDKNDKNDKNNTLSPAHPREAEPAPGLQKPNDLQHCIDTANAYGITPEEAEMYYHKRDRFGWTIQRGDQFVPIKNWVADMQALWRSGYLKPDNKNNYRGSNETSKRDNLRFAETHYENPIDIFAGGEDELEDEDLPY